MMQTPTTEGSSQGQGAGQWVCSYCGCEITVTRDGDPSLMAPGGHYTCRCGTVMDYEPPSEVSVSSTGSSPSGS